METEEKDFLDDVETSHIKPKKQLSEQKLKHLETIRVKALEKKKEMKEITEKANKLKEIVSVTAPVSALPPDLSGHQVYCDVRGGRPPPAAPSKHEPWSASCLPRKPAGPRLHDSCSPEPQPRKTLQYMSARLRQQPRKLNASECWLILRSPSSQVNPSSRPPPDCLPIGVLLVV